MYYPYKNWGTMDEIRFIDRLGTFARDQRGDLKDRRKELLLKYGKSLVLRNRWGRLDSNKIGDHVRECLFREWGITFMPSLPCLSVKDA